MRLLIVSIICFFTVLGYSQEPVFVLNPTGHSGGLQGMLAMPDSKTIITFGIDKSMCLWDAASGKLLRKLWLDIGEGDLGRFIDMDISKRSGLIALARINSSGTPVVNLLDLTNNRILGTFQGFSHALSFVRIDPHEQFIITGTTGVDLVSEPLRLWKIPASQNVGFKIDKASAQLDGVSVHDFTFYNKGREFLINTTYGADIAVRVVHDPSAIPEYSLTKITPPVKVADHMSNADASNATIQTSHDGEVSLWNGKTEQLFQRRKGWGTLLTDTAVWRIAISPSAHMFALGAGVKTSRKDVIKLFSIATRREQVKFPGSNYFVFVSDTLLAYDSPNGIYTYNIVKDQHRALQHAPQHETDTIAFAHGPIIAFDQMRSSFDFAALQMQPIIDTKTAEYATAKWSFNGRRIELFPVGGNIKINKQVVTIFPYDATNTAVSYLNNGMLVCAKSAFRSTARYLLLYDLSKPLGGRQDFEPVSSMEGNFGSIISIAPHPDLSNNVFAARDGQGTIAVYDPQSPAKTIYKNTLRFWPFENLSLDASARSEVLSVTPYTGYTGTLKKGDKLLSVNSVKMKDSESLIRYLETLDPLTPVDLEVTRNGQSLHSLEKLSTLQKRNQLISVMPFQNNEWLCWTPQGYYASSPGAERLGGWVVNDKVNSFANFHPLNDFKKEFYRPELLKLIARHLSFEEAVKAYNLTAPQPVSLLSTIGEKLPPTIEWQSPAADTVVTRSAVKFIASIASSSKLQSAKVLLNGRTILRRDQIRIQERGEQNFAVSFELDLVAANNIINLYVENENGSTVSTERVVNVSVTGQGLEKYKPNLYLLSVGVSAHSNPGYALNFADNDAKSVEQIYMNQKGLLFKNVYSRVLLNEQATRNSILESFYWLEQNATQKDVVVIFIASHGLNDRDKFYILPYDGDPEKIRITGVDWSNFADVLGNLPSKVILFVDACHSGKLGTNILAKRGDDNLLEAIRALATEENGVVIMAASTGKESSLESLEWKHGAFTLALIEGLGDGKADLNNDKIINIREIDYFIAERVKELTGGRQHPTTQKPSIVSEFPLVIRN